MLQKLGIIRLHTSSFLMFISNYTFYYLFVGCTGKKNLPKRIKKGGKEAEAIVSLAEPSKLVAQAKKRKRGKEVVHTIEDSPAKNTRKSQRNRKMKLVIDL